MRAFWRVSVGLLIGLLLLPMAQAGGLTDMQGHARSIADYTGKGKWTVVMIWASDCLVCNKEAFHYVDFQTFHSDKDARVLGISMDGPSGVADAKAFIDRNSINFPNLIGEPEEVAGIYTDVTGQPWRGTPTFLIYDPKGKLRAEQVGAVPTELITDFIARNGAN